jgi:hypothetical protein
LETILGIDRGGPGIGIGAAEHDRAAAQQIGVGVEARDIDGRDNIDCGLRGVPDKE